MKRREFIALIGGAAAWSHAVRAQPGERLRRIGILMPFSPTDAEMQGHLRAFREELRKRGWAAGVNVTFDERWTLDNMDLIRSAAANLVELKPDAILAVGARVIPLLMKLTSSIPIVIPGGTDPVERGYVASLAHPGGNVTGFAVLESSVYGKMLQMLKEIAPHLARVSMIYNPDNPAGASVARGFESIAGQLGIEPIVAYIRSLSDIERAVAAAATQPNAGILVPLDLTTITLAKPTVAVVARHRLPAIYAERVFVAAGGLAFYGIDRINLYRGAASYVDRILHGEKPGDLPYQLPTKYDLVINVKTAKELGLDIPSKVLFTADEVIE